MIFILFCKDNYLYLHRVSNMKHANKYTKNLTMAKILVENGERAYLGKLFGVSQPTIRRALDGKTNTDLAKKIRKVAIDRGGVVQPTRIYKR